MQDYYVSELMTTDVVTCSPKSSLKDVVGTISTKGFSCVVVVDDQVPVGIITEKDLVEILADMLTGITWGDFAIEHFMTTPIITIPDDLTLFEAAVICRAAKIRHIPVIDSLGNLAGLVTQTNIVEAYYNDAH